MRASYFICFVVTLLLSGCKKEQSSVPAELLFSQTWYHAHEEDQGDVRVYRPNTYAFPPSRGRTGFAFDHNGLFTQYDIAPTDGIEGHKGSWTALNNYILRITLDDKKEPDYTLEIVSLENDVLKVRR